MRIKKMLGVTLVEVMLVIIIGAAILLFSLRQYESYKIEADALQLKTNVDILLQSLSKFYFANCYGSVDPTRTPPLIPGLLNPSRSPANPFPINIQSQLVASGFLSAEPFPLANPIVDSGSTPTQFAGYVAQLNQTTQPRVICKAGTNATGTTAARGCTNTGQTGTIIIWMPQVAVLIKDASKVNAYAGLLNADCTSSSNGATVFPCASNRRGNYLVWERTPSYPSIKANSSFGGLQGMLNNFNFMYRTYSTVYLLDVSGVTTPASQTQYFLCGG